MFSDPTVACVLDGGTKSCTGCVALFWGGVDAVADVPSELRLGFGDGLATEPSVGGTIFAKEGVSDILLLLTLSEGGRVGIGGATRLGGAGIGRVGVGGVEDRDVGTPGLLPLENLPRSIVVHGERIIFVECILVHTYGLSANTRRYIGKKYAVVTTKRSMV